MGKYLMALDQGTTSSRCILFDISGNIVSIAQQEFTQYYPKNGWVEHDPMEIWETQSKVAKEAMKKINASCEDIYCIGITNQRETTIVWDKNTGKPIYNAIVWQCHRTSDYCKKLIDKGYTDIIKQKTGLIADPYFSATKIKWILDNVKDARKKAENGELIFGNIDTWLIWNLTKGKLHITDYSNASRTMLYNINDLDWDNDILSIMNIPKSMLPKVMPSSMVYGTTDESIFGKPIIISGIAGDQQSALFGQMCFSEGMAKNTYGTGCFMLMNTGEKPIFSKSGLLTTIAWGIDGKINYALEGSVFIGGAVIQWLRDELGFIEKASDSEKLALSVQNNNGVYVVPAFVGLGAPYWAQDARGIITGLTRGTNKNHITRAALESIAYQSYDVLKAMEKDSKIKLKSLNVDGGASANNFLMQFQSDIIDTNIIRPACIETTALGAAYLAGLGAGVFKDFNDIKEHKKDGTTFSPKINSFERITLLNGWKNAIKKTLCQ